MKYCWRKQHMNLKNAKSYTERNTLWQPSFEHTLTKTSMLKMFATFRLLVQKQSPRGVPTKTCSENMQQIYRRTPMPMCDFNKVALHVYWNQTSAWVSSFIKIILRHVCSPVKLLHIFRTPFLKNISGRLLLLFYF